MRDAQVVAALVTSQAVTQCSKRRHFGSDLGRTLLYMHITLIDVRHPALFLIGNMISYFTTPHHGEDVS